MRGRFGLAIAVLLVLPTFSQAQRATGNFRPVTSAPASAAAVHNTAVRARGGNRPTNGHAARGLSAAHSSDSSLGATNFGSLDVGIDPLSAQILDPLASLGFGFDFAHEVAVRDAELKAFIDPATQQRLALAERRSPRFPHPDNGFFFLDGGGAYALPTDPGNVNADADPQAPQDQNQDPGQNGQGPSGNRAQQGSQQGSQRPIIIVQQPAESKEQPDLPDEGEFTLILRSGQEIEAVAFTRVDDRIVYITTGGGRRTVAVRELDIDATMRLNQERGTPLQLPL